jgi:hypothetical protein
MPARFTERRRLSHIYKYHENIFFGELRIISKYFKVTSPKPESETSKLRMRFYYIKRTTYFSIRRFSDCYTLTIIMIVHISSLRRIMNYQYYQLFCHVFNVKLYI